MHNFVEFRPRLFSFIFISCAIGLLAGVLLLPASGKITILESTFGIFSLLLGVSLLDQKRLLAKEPAAWIQYFPLGIVIGIDLLAPFLQPIVSAVAFTCALTCLLPLSQMRQVSRSYFLLMATFLVASIAYNVFYYYPLNIGIDSWGYLSVSSATIQTGGFTNASQPTSEYYWPFPVMSLVTSALSLVSGLNLPVSLFIFPGALILLQPMLVFLLARRLFDTKAAYVSAFIVLLESAVTQWLGAPIAESVAISLMLMLLLLSVGPRGRPKIGLMLIIFLVLVAVHGSAALVSLSLFAYLSLRKIALQLRSVVTLVAIFLVYQLISAVIDTMVFAISNAGQIIFQFFFAPSVPRTATTFSVGNEGILFVWYGLPAALALFSFLIKRKDPVNIWVFAGGGLLGLSFIANIVAPNIYLDRYGGLAGWLILAMTGGHTLRGLVRSSRRMFLLLPVVLLVVFSAIVYPAMSPQYGFAPPSLLSTNSADRAAMHVANTYGGGSRRIIGDIYSVSYLSFISYQSGHLAGRDLDHFPTNVTNPFPEIDALNMIRWTTTNVTSPDLPCSHLTSYLANDTVNIVFDNSCDIFAVYD